MIILFLEVTSFLIFLICLYHSRKSVKSVLLLVSSIIYAVMFENLNILLSAGKIGGYFYSSQFNLFIFHTPLFIIFCWSFLIYGVYHLLKKLKVKEWIKPFAGAVLVTAVDFIVDPIAVRLHLWTWIGYSAKEGFLGVPGNNFLGWLLVSFFFLLVFGTIEHSKLRWKNLFYLITPLIAYLGFLFTFTSINWIQQIFKFSKFTELIFFLIIYSCFALIGFRKH